MNAEEAAGGEQGNVGGRGVQKMCKDAVLENVNGEGRQFIGPLRVGNREERREAFWGDFWEEPWEPEIEIRLVRIRGKY